MAYELQVERIAKRSIERLAESDYGRVASAIDALATEPRPRGTRKLRGASNLWRIRVGEYRVVYAIFDKERLVKIIDVRRRTTTTYEGLS